LALPTDEEIKAYLRVTTDVEDELIETINASSRALIAARLKVPLEEESRTFYARWPREGRRREALTQLVVPVIPCASTATILDADEATVDADTYTIDSRTGFIEADRYEVFANGPYDITLGVGWETHPDYNTVVEPLLRQAIIDFAADLYRRRNPGAVYEQSGGQVSITYTEQELADRTQLYLRALQALIAGPW
jgi:uncharacterized phiE125 gp8 family phage protein